MLPADPTRNWRPYGSQNTSVINVEDVESQNLVRLLCATCAREKQERSAASARAGAVTCQVLIRVVGLLVIMGMRTSAVAQYYVHRFAFLQGSVRYAVR